MSKEPIRLSLEAAKEQYDNEAVTVLDVVDPGPYEKFSYQVQDAVRIDPREIDEAFSRLPKSETILTYCT